MVTIVGTLPYQLANGTIADAAQVLGNENYIASQVNSNAFPLASAGALAYESAVNLNTQTTGFITASAIQYTNAGIGGVATPLGALLDATSTNVRAFGASGSSLATTGSISSASTNLVLASALDFSNGQGIRVNNAGPTFLLNQPSTLTVTPTGTTGSTTYTYTIAALDGNGGVGAAIATVSTSTGNALLSLTNYNTLSWVAPSGTAPAGYAVYGRLPGGLALIAIVSGTSYKDFGYATDNATDWIPSTPPVANLADWLITSIVSGAGTTSLVLADTATLTAASVTVSHDDTAAIRAAIAAAQTNGGGVVFFPYGKYSCTSTLSITASKVALIGASRRLAILQWVGGSADCITASGTSYANPITGFELSSLTFTFKGKTGGRTLASAFVDRTIIRDIDVEGCYTGFEIYASNDAYLDNIIFQLVLGGPGTNFSSYGDVSQKPTACYGIFWHGAGDGSATAIQLTTVNVTVSAYNSGADGLIWDGNASTWNMFQTTVLNARYGLWVKNTAASNVNVPTFMSADNFNVDGANAVGMRVDGGNVFQLSNCAISNTSPATGATDTNAILINPDTGVSYTREFYFSGCRIGYSKQSAVVVNCLDAQFVGCTFIAGSSTPSGTYPAIEVGAAAADVVIVGCKTAVYGSSNDWKYGVQVDAGSARVVVVANDIRGYTSRAINWQNGDLASVDYGNGVGTTPTTTDPVAIVLPQDDNVTGNYTITATRLLGGVYTAGGTPGAFLAATDTAANLVAALQSPDIGKGINILVINATNGVMTLAPGSGVSMSGNISGGHFLIASGASRTLCVRFDNVASGAEAVTIYG